MCKKPTTKQNSEAFGVTPPLSCVLSIHLYWLCFTLMLFQPWKAWCVVFLLLQLFSIMSMVSCSLLCGNFFGSYIKITEISKNSPGKSNDGAEITTVWKTKYCT